MRRISFETAKLAAEKGYDEDCDYIYDIHGNIIYIDNYVWVLFLNIVVQLLIKKSFKSG